MPWGLMRARWSAAQNVDTAEAVRRRALHARAVERRRKAKRGGKR